MLRDPLIHSFTKKIIQTRSQSSSNEVIFVVQGLKSNLLEFPAIQNLGLIKQLNSVNAADSIKQRFAKVFEGLGTLWEEYKKDNATLYSLYTPRKSKRRGQADGSYGSDI